jgi:cytochrome c-type biogenesis protein CcmH
MQRHRSIILFLILSAGLSACGEKARPVEEAPPPAAAGAPPALPDGHPPVAGHPPIDGHPLQDGPAPADGGTVKGSIDVAKAHRPAIQGGAIFVIARRAGTREVVAVRKAESLDLPQAFTLSAADVMMGGVAFAGPFDVTARWTSTGDAMPAPGDIEGTARDVAVGATDVKVTLSEVRP